MKIMAVMGAIGMIGGMILAFPSYNSVKNNAEAEAESASKGKMFSNGAGIDPLSSPLARSVAFGKYEKTHRDGPLIKRLRIAQAIFVAGFLILIIGSSI